MYATFSLIIVFLSFVNLNLLRNTEWETISTLVSCYEECLEEYGENKPANIACVEDCNTSYNTKNGEDEVFLLTETEIEQDEVFEREDLEMFSESEEAGMDLDDTTIGMFDYVQDEEFHI